MVLRGHGQKYTRFANKVAEARAGGLSFSACAFLTGLSRRTLLRWNKFLDFHARCEKARKENAARILALEEAIHARHDNKAANRAEHVGPA